MTVEIAVFGSRIVVERLIPDDCDHGDGDAT
jgi:hypothetical protein